MSSTVPPNKTNAALPPLAPVLHIDQRLDPAEYYHASIGRYQHALIPCHDVVYILEGEGSINPEAWQAALNQAAAVNPGARLRLQGQRQQARWVSDGQAPRLRILEDCAWDGRSSLGAEFIAAQPLRLEEGESAELIVLGRDKIKVIFRVSHAVMDGMGALHFLQEFFRALRGEPLLGSNATYSEIDLIKTIPRLAPRAKNLKPSWLTGGIQGDEPGGIWKRISITAPQPNLIARIIQILAEQSRKLSSAPIRIAIPSNLRRHAPDLLTTMNFSGMPFLDLDPQGSLELPEIKHGLKAMLDLNMDADYQKVYETIRYLPFSWVDRLMSISTKNLTSFQIRETAVLTVLGTFKRTIYSGGGFKADRIFLLPQLENFFITVVGMQGHFDLCIGTPRVLASNGRLDALLLLLEQRLQAGHDIV